MKCPLPLINCPLPFMKCSLTTVSPSLPTESTSLLTAIPSLADLILTLTKSMTFLPAPIVVFATRKPRPAGEPFEKLVEMIRGWLSVGWTSMKRAGTNAGERTFLAQDRMTGTLLTLAVSGPQVYFLVKRTPV
jgi:hypothetical protein